jgi:hypothetical protein
MPTSANRKVSGIREWWLRALQRQTAEEARPAPPAHLLCLFWAGLGAFVGAMMAMMGPADRVRADPWSWGLAGAVVGVGFAVTIIGLQLPRARRWMALVVGVLMVVTNALPDYHPMSGGYYSWTTESRWLLGIGVVLVLFAALTKPKDEPF